MCFRKIVAPALLAFLALTPFLFSQTRPKPPKSVRLYVFDNGVIKGLDPATQGEIVIRTQKDESRHLILFHATAIDVYLRNFALRAQQFARRIQFSGPFLMKATLWTPMQLVNYETDGVEDGQTGAGLYPFPSLRIIDLLQPFERIILPFCDMAHQIFGNEKSPCFDGEGRWIARF